MAAERPRALLLDYAGVLTVPIGEFTGSDVGSVVVWDHDKAAQLFDALAADQPVPAAVLGD